MITIEEFFKNSTNEQIQEFLRNIDMDRFVPLLEEYPPFVKQRVLENIKIFGSYPAFELG